MTLNERLCDLEIRVNSNKESDSAASSPHEKSNNTVYERRSTRSQDSIQRQLSETSLSELENGPSKQKRKRLH